MAGTPDIAGTAAGQITTVGHTSIFPQTGSWSMVDLLSKPLNLTVGALQRYSAARVDPYTFVVGQAICSKFRLGSEGRRNLDKALSNLTALRSFGDMMYFGFGIEDLVRSLVKTEEGAVCVALCAALRECYHEDIAVEVLLELARLTSVPGKYLPSSREWKGLLNACSGPLAATTFPLLAEQFMILLRPEEHPRSNSEYGFKAQDMISRGCSTPESIAQAVFAMARVTTGELEAITIVGGADAGWLAALGQWLFDCKIKLKSAGGTVLYQNSEAESNVQLEIVSSPKRAEIGTSLPVAQEIQIRHHTYVLDDATVLFNGVREPDDIYVVSGRVPWERALSSTFMSDFPRLMEMPRTVGRVIGCAARMFKEVSNSNESIPEIFQSSCTTYCRGSYGSGFLQNTVSWFPELANLSVHMESAAVLGMDDARKIYDLEMRNLIKNCTCGCKAILAPSHALYAWEKPCLGLIVETIICLSRTLALMNVAKDLYPSRAGIVLAYQRQFEWKIPPDADKLRTEKNLGLAIRCLRPHYIETHPSWLLEQVSLFTGCSIRGMFRNIGPPNALSSNGICTFLGILRDFSPRTIYETGIYIIPGYINLEGKRYNILSDDSLRDCEAKSFWDSFNPQDITFDRGSILKLRVKEASNSLLSCVQARQSGLEATRSTLLIGPAMLQSDLFHSKGVVTCKRDGKCKRVRHAILSNAIKPIKHKNIFLQAVNAETNVQAIAIFAAVSTMKHLWTVFVIEDECLDCCTRAAVKAGKMDGHHFCFLRMAF